MNIVKAKAIDFALNELEDRLHIENRFKLVFQYSDYLLSCNTMLKDRSGKWVVYNTGSSNVIRENSNIIQNSFEEINNNIDDILSTPNEIDKLFNRPNLLLDYLIGLVDICDLSKINLESTTIFDVKILNSNIKLDFMNLENNNLIPISLVHCD